MPNQVPKDTKRRKNAPQKRLRDQQIIVEASKGRGVGELAEQFDICRQQVRKILNKTEAMEIVKQGDSDLLQLVSKSVDVVEMALDRAQVDMTNALKAASSILKTVGIVKEKSEIEVTMPKPTIITKRDGTQVILGVEQEDE